MWTGLPRLQPACAEDMGKIQNTLVLLVRAVRAPLARNDAELRTIAPALLYRTLPYSTPPSLITTLRDLNTPASTAMLVTIAGGEN